MKLFPVLCTSFLFVLLAASPAKADPLIEFYGDDSGSGPGVEEYLYFLYDAAGPPTIDAGDSFTYYNIAPNAILGTPTPFLPCTLHLTR